MQIAYQPTLVPGTARAVTLNYTDDSTPANSITMFNVSLATSTDAGTGRVTATVVRVDGNGIAMTDASGTISAVAEDATEDAAVKAAALVLAPRVLPLPALASLTPVNGPAAGGTAVTIAGTHLTGATAVQFGGVDAVSFTVDSMMQISAVAPAGAAGPADVTVTTPGGIATLEDGFTYVAAPAPAAVAPDTGPAAGGTSVVIQGTDLAGARAVTVGGVAAESFTVDGPTQITAVTPPGAAGPADLAVTTAGGTGTLAGGFTYE